MEIAEDTDRENGAGSKDFLALAVTDNHIAQAAHAALRGRRVNNQRRVLVNADDALAVPRQGVRLVVRAFGHVDVEATGDALLRGAGGIQALLAESEACLLYTSRCV